MLLLPREPIDRVVAPVARFLHVEAASGVVLLLCAVVALIMANSPWSQQYLGFWESPVGLLWGEWRIEHPLKHWINDGLMAIFFFVIGLEIKREIVHGELRDFRSAALPLAAALGGMAAPAAIYLALRGGAAGASGWGVPMATDIAFVVGCMALLQRRVPGPLRVVLLTLAIADDIGAILVIAIGYTDSLDWGWLAVGVGGVASVLVLQRLGVRTIPVYVVVGAVAWFGFHESGVHATVAGVALGVLTPARPYFEVGASRELLEQASSLLHGEADDYGIDPGAVVRRSHLVSRETISPVEYLLYTMHPWVAFLIMPVFALANAGVAFRLSDVLSPVALAVVAGLMIGKPVGILSLSWLATKTRIATLPEGVTWRQLAGAGFLAGVGFTMALFIAGLAFTDEGLLRPAKVGVLMGSLASALIGMALLAIPSRAEKVSGVAPSDA